MLLKTTATTLNGGSYGPECVQKVFATASTSDEDWIREQLRNTASG